MRDLRPIFLGLRMPLNPFRKRNREHRTKKTGREAESQGTSQPTEHPRLVILRSADGTEWTIQGWGSEPTYPDWRMEAPGNWTLPDFEWDRTEHDGDDDE